jgi:hypothetical protein
MEKEQASKKTISRTKKGKSQLLEQLEINRSGASSPKKGSYKLDKKQQQSNQELLADDFALVKDGGLCESARLDVTRAKWVKEWKDYKFYMKRATSEHNHRRMAREINKLPTGHRQQQRASESQGARRAL